VLSIGGNVCTAIAHFNGVQTVDGLDEEFCGIVATEFDVATGAWQQPGDGGADVDTVAYLRVAWDAVGLHLFINVVQPVVIAPSAYAYIWTGDAVEIFASATGTLKGSYGPGADPALQVIVSAPSSSSPALSQELTSVTGPTVALDASSFAVRLVPSGYNVEVELPWSLIAGGQDIEPEGGTRGPVPPVLRGRRVRRGVPRRTRVA
jgi:hypothetical protein